MKPPLLPRIRVNRRSSAPTSSGRTTGQWSGTACATAETRPDLFREVREPESVERTVRVAAHPAVWCAGAAVRGRRGMWYETVARVVLQGLHMGLHLSKSQGLPGLGLSGTRFAVGRGRNLCGTHPQRSRAERTCCNNINTG